LHHTAGPHLTPLERIVTTATARVNHTVASDLLVGDVVHLGQAWRSVRYLVTCLADRTQTVITADGGEYELPLDQGVTYRA
jgi:hypothetical protein